MEDTQVVRETSVVKNVRLLLDEDLNPLVAEIGRGLGLDVISVHEIDRRGYADEEQLRFAIGEGRVFVTRNRDDFLRLTVSLYRAEEFHHGLVIVPYSVPNHRPERIAHALKRWADRFDERGPHFVDFLS